jgi:alpha-glucosidase
LKTSLDFLDPEREYIAEIYADADDADWESNPLAINIYEREVDHTTSLEMNLAPGGGQAIRLRPSD